MRLPRSMVALIGGIVALLLAGLTLALLTSRRPEASFPPDSPEGTVATYLRLLQDGRLDEAYALTAFESPGGPGYPDGPLTATQFQQRFDRWSQSPHRVTLLRANTTGERASVIVEISTFSPDAFGGSDNTSQQTFTLARRDGVWRITGPPYLRP